MTTAASKELRTLDTKQEKVVKILVLRQQAIDQSRALIRSREEQAESHGRAACGILDLREWGWDRGWGSGLSLVLETLFQSLCWRMTAPFLAVQSNIPKLMIDILS